MAGRYLIAERGMNGPTGAGPGDRRSTQKIAVERRFHLEPARRAVAVLLGKLCAALDVTLSAVIGLSDSPPERLSRLADQAVWRDPDTGYRRRHASAQNVASGIEIIVVDLPGGARVQYSPWGRRAYTQQLLMLEGRIIVHIDLKRFDLFEGDCLDFDVMRAVSFENPRDELAKYIVIVRHS
jgi:mannose-6-phosphate isomerase-like protein (cupin superfamily)